MKGEQREQVRKAVRQIGQDLADEYGKDTKKLSREAIIEQMMPKNTLGLSDNMLEGLYGQAYRLYNTGKYKDACQMFRLLVMIDSTEPKFALGLAACQHMMKEYMNALSTYALCGIIDPDNPIPHYHSADCYLQLKDKVSAIISLEMAVKRSGNRPEYEALKDRASVTIESLKKDAKLPDLPVEKKKPKGKQKKKK